MATIEITPTDASIGALALLDMAAGRTIFTKGQLARACLNLAMTAAQLGLSATMGPIALTPAIFAGDELKAGQTFDNVGELEPVINGTYRQIRDIYHRARRVNIIAPKAAIPPGGVVDGVTAAGVIITVLGVAAIVTGGWWAGEASEHAMEVSKEEAKQTGETARYLEWARAKAAMGEAIGEPPEAVKQAAEAQSTAPYYAVGAAVLLGIAGAVAHVRMSPNPLYNGYSQATITRNTNELVRAGYAPGQARSIALRKARASHKATGGATPKHLKKATTKRASKKKTAKSTTRSRTKKRTTKKRTTKKAAKKRTNTTKKRTTKKATKKRPTKKRTTKKKNPTRKRDVSCKRPKKTDWMRKHARKRRKDGRMPTKKQLESTWRLVWGCKKPARRKSR